MFRVLVADKYALYREGIKHIFAKDATFEVVSETEDGDALLEQALASRPDVILTDIEMPGLPVFDAARQVLMKLPRTKLAFFAEHEDEGHISRALKLRASYILKDTPPGQMLAALKQIARGQAYLSPTVRSKVENITALRRQLSENPVSLCTSREREILKRLAEGVMPSGIAEELSLSVKTIEAHKFNLMQKLDIHNKIELMRFAVRENLVPCPGHGRCYRGDQIAAEA